MKERALAFRNDKGLVGILSQPRLAPASPLPTVLFLNAGLIHRIGPFRLHVELARHFAEIGFSSLRFDLSGIGDSQLRRDNATAVDRNNDDIRHAMQAAIEVGCSDRFVVFGLCTGARNAHNIARADARVAGAILVDPYGYMTLGYRVMRYGPRLIDPRTSVRVARRLVRRLRGTDLPVVQDHAPNPEQEDIFGREFPPRDEAERDLKEILRRGTKLLFVYTGGAVEYFNHRSQFFSFFPSIKGEKDLEVLHLPDTDHTFTLLQHRSDFIAHATDWLRTSFSMNHCPQ